MIYNIITSHSIEIALTLESMSMGSKCMTRPMPYGTWAKHIKVNVHAQSLILPDMVVTTEAAPWHPEDATVRERILASSLLSATTR